MHKMALKMHIFGNLQAFYMPFLGKLKTSLEFFNLSQPVACLCREVCKSLINLLFKDFKFAKNICYKVKCVDWYNFYHFPTKVGKMVLKHPNSPNEIRGGQGYT